MTAKNTPVYDLDAAVAEKHAGVAPFLFRWGGKKYEAPIDADLEAIEAFDRGDLLDGLRLLLGDEQWENMRASGTPIGVTALRLLVDQWMAHVGINPGEGPASSSS